MADAFEAWATRWVAGNTEPDRETADGVIAFARAAFAAGAAEAERLRGALAALVELVEMDDDFNNPREVDAYAALVAARAALGDSAAPRGGGTDDKG